MHENKYGNVREITKKRRGICIPIKFLNQLSGYRDFHT